MCAGGCAAPWRDYVGLPRQHELVRQELVIHSDFALAAHHRLVEDLVARRADLCRHLDLAASDEPIDIYLFEDGSKYDAYMKRSFPGLPRRRAFFVETDTRLTVYAQWGERVAEDLRHEVTHGYLHAVLPHLPLWLDEGLAEYYETPRGMQGMNRQHVAWIEPQIVDGKFHPDLRRLEQLSPSAEMTEADYAEAWAWVHLLLHSGPEPRAMLRAYLADLRRDEHAEPLSQRLLRIAQDPSTMLAEHIRRFLPQNNPPQRG